MQGCGKQKTVVVFSKNRSYWFLRAHPLSVLGLLNTAPVILQAPRGRSIWLALKRFMKRNLFNIAPTIAKPDADLMRSLVSFTTNFYSLDTGTGALADTGKRLFQVSSGSWKSKILRRSWRKRTFAQLT